MRCCDPAGGVSIQVPEAGLGIKQALPSYQHVKTMAAFAPTVRGLGSEQGCYVLAALHVLKSVCPVLGPLHCMVVAAESCSALVLQIVACACQAYRVVGLGDSA